MATTGFWPVRGKLKEILDYADNPDKTTERDFLDDDLYVVTQYAENDQKTDRKMYVSGINCSGHLAYEQMVSVKRKFGERGKVIAYHGFQSFAEGEVTPEEAHKIGVKTARRMWGDRFQVLVTTHLNTENLHNHFVVNSVSCKDGKKFVNAIAEHHRIREVSDEVCREFGKSVLEHSKFHGKGRGAYWYEKTGGKTHRYVLREDIEYCIRYAHNRDEFERQLYGLGYTIDVTRWSVMAKDWERAVRLDRLGYSKQEIQRRLDENDKDTFFDLHVWNYHLPKKRQSAFLYYLQKELNYDLFRSHDAAEQFVDLMFLILVELLRFAKEAKDTVILSVELRHEIKDITTYISDYKYLRENNIRTFQNLDDSINETKAQIAELEISRSKADNERRRADSPEKVQAAKDKRHEITKQIDPLRKKLKRLEKIAEKSPHLYELLKKEAEMEAPYRNQI